MVHLPNYHHYHKSMKSSIFLIELINTISNLSFKDWLLSMLTGITIFLCWLVYSLQTDGELIQLIKSDEANFRTIDQCLLRVERDNHILYRVINIPETIKYSNYEFWVGFVSQDNADLSDIDYLEKFYEQCWLNDRAVDILRQGFKENREQIGDVFQ